MDDDTILLIGGVAVAAFFLKDTLKPIGEGTGRVLGSTADILELPNTAAQGIVGIIDTAKENAARNKIIAEGERVQTIIDIPKTATLIAAQKTAASPTSSNIKQLQATVAIQQAKTPVSVGGTGLLPPSIINLGSTPVKTQTFSTYAKIDQKLGGWLPFGVPRKK